MRDPHLSENDILSYLRGELSEEKRDACETHFFECKDCGDHVRGLSSLYEAVRQAKQYKKRKLSIRIWGLVGVAVIVIVLWLADLFGRF